MRDEAVSLLSNSLADGSRIRYLIVMPANLAPEVFEIEAASQAVGETGDERYVIRTQLIDGHWETAPTNIIGIYDVRWFLNDNGVNDKEIAFAIEELSRRRRVTVSKPSWKAA